MANNIRRKQQTRDFTVLPNSIFRRQEDNLITAQAMGLLCYLLHLHGDWKIRKTELHRHFKNGRDATIKAFDELVEVGYIDQIPLRSKTGKFLGNDYLVSDEQEFINPITENQESGKNTPFPENPLTDNPCTVLPFTDNQEVINNIDNNNCINKLSINSIELIEAGKKNEVIKTKSLYSRFIDAYYIFYQEINGLPPKIDGASGAASKQIIAHLKTVARSKDPNLKNDDDRLDQEVIKMADFIFFNWSLVRPFLRDQYNLMQINSNLNNIMADIKGTPAEKRKQKDSTDAFVYFKDFYNGK